MLNRKLIEKRFFNFYSDHFLVSNRKSLTLIFKESRYGLNLTSNCVFLSINSCATVGFAHAITITPPPIIEYGFDLAANFAPATLPQNLYKFERVIAFLKSFCDNNSAINSSVVTKSVYKIFFKFASS